MKRILVTGAGGNASRNFIASLRMADEPFYVVGVDTNPFHLECAEVEARYQVPRCDDPGYLEALKAVIAREDIELVHPQPDVEVGFLSAHRDELPARMMLPSDQAVQICHDKLSCNRVLNGAGVPVPRSYQIPCMDAVPRLLEALRQQQQKVWLRAIRGAGSRAALPVTSSRQAQDWIHYWVHNKGLAPRDFMLAEFLPGREFAFQSLWHEGQLVTAMARERMEYLMGNLMPSGQSSSPSIARTVHRVDVNSIGTQAVMAVDKRPHGIYCVDMKENLAGQPCVTEINLGRFFTTSNFFSQAGCNMPYYYVKLAFDEPSPNVAVYNPLEAELYWIRGVDREPKLFKGAVWTAKFAA